MSESYDSMQAWIASRPECVQKLAQEFPLGTLITDENETRYFLIGYTEDDRLIISPVDPHEDYDRARDERSYICAEHLRAQRPS